MIPFDFPINGLAKVSCNINKLVNNDCVIKHLENIDTESLVKRIFDFRKISIKNINDQDLRQEILNVLIDDGKFICIPNIGVYPKGTQFFRVRRLPNIVMPTITPLKCANVESDFWNPPAECVTSYGRINKPGESLLYASPLSPYIALNEMKIKNEDYFILIVYDAIKEVKGNMIGCKYNYEILNIHNKKAITNNEILNNFLSDEFVRDVGGGTEFLYRVSEIIAKSYFDIPSREVQDAWVYPSVQDKKEFNICFRPEIAKDVLSLRGAIIAKSVDNEKILSAAVLHGFDAEGKIKYHAIGSNVQKEIFPEIK